MESTEQPTMRARHRQDVVAPRQPAKRPRDPLAYQREHALTKREIEVVELIADGLRNRDIGLRLRVSEETVKSHVAHLFDALRARTRAHAVAIALRRGLIR